MSWRSLFKGKYLKRVTSRGNVRTKELDASWRLSPGKTAKGDEPVCEGDIVKFQLKDVTKDPNKLLTGIVFFNRETYTWQVGRFYLKDVWDLEIIGSIDTTPELILEEYYTTVGNIQP